MAHTEPVNLTLRDATELLRAIYVYEQEGDPDFSLAPLQKKIERAHKVLKDGRAATQGSGLRRSVRRDS